MLKVSFKQNSRLPVRMIKHEGNLTTATLRGVVQLPNFLIPGFPAKVLHWVESCQNVVAHVNIYDMYLVIKGKAKRAPEDADDPVFAERLAECRAKLHLYKFMRCLCQKLLSYYTTISYGNKVSTSTLEQDGDHLYGTLWKYRDLYAIEKSHLIQLLNESHPKSSPEHQ